MRASIRFLPALLLLTTVGLGAAPSEVADAVQRGDTAAVRQSVQAVILAYRKTFDQQSVLWESARVCVAT